MHFSCDFLDRHCVPVDWRQAPCSLQRSDLNLYTILLTQVLDHFGWEEFGGGADVVRLQKSTVGLQPTAEGLWADARCTGKFNLGSGFHGVTTIILFFYTSE